METDTTTHLERRDPARNMKRFYRLAVERDLFGTVLLVREWGRIGTFGRRREAEMADPAEAEREARALAGWKRRRGYRPVA